MSSKFESFQVPFLSSPAVAIKWLCDTKHSDTFSHFSAKQLRGACHTARLSEAGKMEIFRIRTRQLKRKSKQDIRKSDKIGEIEEGLKIEVLKWRKASLVAEIAKLSEEIANYEMLVMV